MVQNKNISVKNKTKTNRTHYFNSKLLIILFEFLTNFSM